MNEEAQNTENSAFSPKLPEYTGTGKSEYVTSLELYLQLLQKEIEHLRSKEIPGKEIKNSTGLQGRNFYIDQSRFYNCSNINELVSVFEEYAGSITNPIETYIFLLGSDRKIVFPELSPQETAVTEITRKLEEEGLTDWAIDKKELTFIPNIYEETQENLTKILLYPLYLKDNPIGIIVSKSGRMAELTADEAERINYISDYTRFALDNIRSAEEIRKMNNRLSAMNTQMNRTANFATLGELTAAILKEIDIPLEIIKSNIGFIESGFGDTKRRIEIIKEQLEQLSGKTRKLSDIFKDTGREPASIPVNLAATLDEALLFTNSQLTRNGIIVEKAIDEPGAEIIAEKAKLEQALLSLIILMQNSLPDGGRLILGIYKYSSRRVVFTASVEGSEFQYSISGKIFEKAGNEWNPVIQLLQANVESLAGRIEIITEQGKGTTIKLIFPVFKF